ncbi:MAG TPA: alpha/beta fold hydrolase [Thermoanaerobaculia bacterium]|nr:alpha/beta fold hydrolase [Thermoanaerobaculia bacterium]
MEALREAGYHVLAVDLGGFGGTRRHGYLDGDVEAALALLRRRAGALPLHIWGVSAGGYWSHFVLSRQNSIAGAMFEDVSPYLIEWSWRMAPWGRPAFLFYRHALPSPYRFLDIRLHAKAMTLAAVTYVSGALDPGVHPEDTQALAAAAGGRALIVPEADHLGSIKVANEEVIALALDTFRRAEERMPIPFHSRL